MTDDSTTEGRDFPARPPDGSDSADGADALRAENEALRQRNEELERKTARPKRRWQDIWRSVAVVVLIVLGTVLATATVPAIWGRNLILNTDRYVETLKPVASDPGVQAAVVKAVDQQFDSNIDVKSLVTQVLPGRAGALLAGPLEGAANSLVNTVATKFVQSQAFVDIWVGLNKVAHSALVDILTGKHTSNDVLNVRNGMLVLNLKPVIDNVKAQLVSAGLTVAEKVPAVGATINIAEVKGLTKAQSTVSLLNKVANWLPLLALLCYAGAVLAAHRRRRAIVICALTTAFGMLLIAIALLIGRRIYLNDLPLQYLTADDAGRLFDTLVRFLRAGLRTVFVVALLICAIVWFTGTSRQARAVRHGIASGAQNLTSRWAGGALGAAVTAYRGVIATAIVALGALILVLWTNPGVVTAVVIALITAALVVLVYSFKPPTPAPTA